MNTRSISDVLDSERRLAVQVAELQATLRRVRHVVLTGSYARPDPSDWENGYNQALRDVWAELEDDE